ncbi:LiaF transmembrane domain-containing protein [Paenibacillus kobensis]|uniref:LiaF transmembrane domain-containing protein n=1 Tax=Paenibacillus kobensis TaxID=59841 RepID=UPI000FDA91A2|nr:hypothetical protein [Paenibacillus kobensis]
MNMNSTKGIVLIVIGAIIALPLLGIALGGIIKFLFPFILLGLGVVGWRNGNKVIGGLLVGFGGLLVLSKFSHLIMLLIAIALVVYGVSLVKSKRNY